MTRMSSSTPSLPEASNDSTSTNVSVASTDQAASTDNLVAKVWILWYIYVNLIHGFFLIYILIWIICLNWYLYLYCSKFLMLNN